MTLPSSLISYMVAERWASGAAGSGSEARADAGSRRLHALVGQRASDIRVWCYGADGLVLWFVKQNPEVQPPTERLTDAPSQLS